MPDESLRLDDLDLGLEAGFGRPRPKSVLDAMGHGASRVALREPPEGAQSPDLKPAPAGHEGCYQVLGEIGRGAVGVVFKGHDVDLGRAVAIKVMRAEHAGNPGVVQRFVEEAQVGGQLQHPGIVPVYEMGLRDDGKTPWFAMKLVKGRTLAALLAERKSPADERGRFLGMFEQICQTVGYAHSRGVVHRDLKPANVMVGAFGEVQVVDWGFAKVLPHADAENESVVPAPERSVIATVRSGSADSHSVVGSVFGTPAYMPPEQARGNVDDVDERSDVFALGAVLCEILTGKPPYSGDPGRLVMMAAQADLGPAHARLAACGADPQIVGLALACLVPAKLARPRDGGDVAVGVAGYLASEEQKTRAAQFAAVESKAAAARAVADAETARERADHLRRQRRLTVAVAAALVATFAVTGGAWVWLEHHRAERATEVSRDVEAALAQSVFLRGRAVGRADLAAAHDAVDAAQRADEIASTRDVGADVRTRAAQSLAETQAEAVRARKVATLIRRAKTSSYSEASVEALRKATAVYPTCAELHCQIADGLGVGRVVDPDDWREHFPEIESEYRKAIELDPDSLWARRSLIDFLPDRSVRDLEAIAEQDEAVIRIDPLEPAWLAAAFDHSVQRGDFEKAARLAQSAADLDPDEAPLAPRLANVREALDVADGILHGAPPPDAWKAKPWDLVEACMFARRYATIARLWKSPLLGIEETNESPGAGMAALRFAALRAGLGEGTDTRDVADAERMRFRKLSLEGYRSFLAGIRGVAAPGDDARPNCAHALELEGIGSSWPDSPGGLPRAVLMAELPPDERQAWHDAFLEYDRFGRTQTFSDQFFWIMLLSADADNADMIEGAETASRAHPEDVNFKNVLGVAQYRAGRYEKAIETLTPVEAALSASSLGPRPSTSSFLAMAFAKLGRLDRAREWLDRCRVVAAQPKYGTRLDVRERVREAENVIEDAAFAAAGGGK